MGQNSYPEVQDMSTVLQGPIRHSFRSHSFRRTAQQLCRDCWAFKQAARNGLGTHMHHSCGKQDSSSTVCQMKPIPLPQGTESGPLANDKVLTGFRALLLDACKSADACNSVLQCKGGDVLTPACLASYPGNASSEGNTDCKYLHACLLASPSRCKIIHSPLQGSRLLCSTHTSPHCCILQLQF